MRRIHSYYSLLGQWMYHYMLLFNSHWVPPFVWIRSPTSRLTPPNRTSPQFLHLPSMIHPWGTYPRTLQKQCAIKGPLQVLWWRLPSTTRSFPLLRRILPRTSLSVDRWIPLSVHHWILLQAPHWIPRSAPHGTPLPVPCRTPLSIIPTIQLFGESRGCRIRDSCSPHSPYHTAPWTPPKSLHTPSCLKGSPS